MWSLIGWTLTAIALGIIVRFIWMIILDKEW